MSKYGLVVCTTCGLTAHTARILHGITCSLSAPTRFIHDASVDLGGFIHSIMDTQVLRFCARNLFVLHPVPMQFSPLSTGPINTTTYSFINTYLY